MKPIAMRAEFLSEESFSGASGHRGLASYDELSLSLRAELDETLEYLAPEEREDELRRRAQRVRGIERRLGRSLRSYERRGAIAYQTIGGVSIPRSVYEILLTVVLASCAVYFAVTGAWVAAGGMTLAALLAFHSVRRSKALRDKRDAFQREVQEWVWANGSAELRSRALLDQLKMEEIREAAREHYFKDLDLLLTKYVSADVEEQYRTDGAAREEEYFQLGVMRQAASYAKLTVARRRASGAGALALPETLLGASVEVSPFGRLTRWYLHDPTLENSRRLPLTPESLSLDQKQ